MSESATLVTEPKTAHDVGSLRVLFIASYFPRPGRPTAGVWALKPAQALQRQGVEVEVFAPTSWVPRWAARTDGQRVFAECPKQVRWGNLLVHYPRSLHYPFSINGWWSRARPGLSLHLAWWSIRKALLKTVASFKPDVILVHHCLPNGYLAYRLHQKTGLPYVYVDHSFADVLDSGKMPARRRYYQPVAEAAFAGVAVSERMANDRRKCFPKARTVVIHNGADAESEVSAARPPELVNKKVVLCVAFFSRSKSIPLLVEAFAEVRRRVPEAVLRLVGDGEERPQIEDMIRRHNLGDCVMLLGAQPSERVAQELAWCDVFAMIGINEAGSVACTEAISAGRPVVCANDGGINDVVASGVHGFSVPPRDGPATAEAISRLLLDDALRQEMSAACRRLFEEKLSWDASARRLIELLQQASVGTERIAAEAT